MNIIHILNPHALFIGASQSHYSFVFRNKNISVRQNEALEKDKRQVFRLLSRFMDEHIRKNLVFKHPLRVKKNKVKIKNTFSRLKMNFLIFIIHNAFISVP